MGPVSALLTKLELCWDVQLPMGSPGDRGASSLVPAVRALGWRSQEAAVVGMQRGSRGAAAV